MALLAFSLNDGGRIFLLTSGKEFLVGYGSWPEDSDVSDAGLINVVFVIQRLLIYYAIAFLTGAFCRSRFRGDNMRTSACNCTCPCPCTCVRAYVCRLQHFTVMI